MLICVNKEIFDLFRKKEVLRGTWMNEHLSNDNVVVALKEELSEHQLLHISYGKHKPYSTLDRTNPVVPFLEKEGLLTSALEIPP